MKTKVIFILLIFSFLACKETSSSYDTKESNNSFYQEGGASYTNETYSTNSEAYSDGTYSADVDYYNPDTGTNSTYTLNVEVENNEVTVIYWPNGGWLDDSHFSPQELDSNGSCSFISDKGYEYSIHITGSETSYTDEYRARSDSEDDLEAVTCPECGDDKDEYEEYCYYCKKKFTCPECGSKKDKYDDLCDDCQRSNDEENE
ncbi:hypothetical protein FLAN108750_13875 [Flavobacterium antarcticum]|uniref:hypothetical protein n=1 Tax=Flavobacterium antarcticum TaxID=271155 RepID=UPI0003B52499|nr:hypothetical protein [Flavobacterium antarcticum]